MSRILSEAFEKPIRGWIIYAEITIFLSEWNSERFDSNHRKLIIYLLDVNAWGDIEQKFNFLITTRTHTADLPIIHPLFRRLLFLYSAYSNSFFVWPSKIIAGKEGRIYRGRIQIINNPIMWCMYMIPIKIYKIGIIRYTSSKVPSNSFPCWVWHSLALH